MTISHTQMPDEPIMRLVRQIPKVELHRHLEGSVRLNTLVDIARQMKLDFPTDIETLRPLVQVVPGDPRSSASFLGKFQVIRQFIRSREIVERITREAVADSAADNVRYMELRFTPLALSIMSDCSVNEIVPLVCTSATEAAAEHGISVRLIVSINRHETVEDGERALAAAIANQHLGVVGFDLAGDEANHSALPFRDLFRRAGAAGLGLTVHAGEWDGAASVWDAIGNLGAQRVGHGINVLDDPGVLNVLMAREITLEVCPTSNVYSGIVPDLAAHPLTRLMQHGALTTLNTDDPALCNITLSDEMARAMQHLALSLDDLKAGVIRAAQAAFLPSGERAALVRRFQALLADDNAGAVSM